MVFWAGTTISDVGSAIRFLALPLTAIQVLGAGATEMGVLVALGQAPVPLFGLFAGVWVDRLRRRPLMIIAELGRALLLATIPAAAAMGVLTMAQLYLVAFVVGALTVFFDLGITSYLPSLVPRAQLLEGNAKLQMTGQVAAIAGRSGGGALIQVLTAPIAILIDAASYLVSALSLLLIRKSERARTGASGPGLWREIGDGLRLAFREPAIRAMTIASTIGSLGGSFQQTVLLLFLANALGLSPLWIGLITGTAAIAALAGTQLAAPAAERIGPGPALIVGSFLWFVGAALVPLAGLAAPAIPLLLAAQLFTGLATTLYSINQISLRQLITPDALLGRVNATRRVFVFGVIPIGALAAGALGEAIGLRPTLAIGAALSLSSAGYALASPLRTIRTQPTAVSAALVEGSASWGKPN